MNHIKKYENKYCCGLVIPSKDAKVLEFNQYLKSDKAPCMIYGDLESLIKTKDGYKNNSEISSTTKVGEHISFGYSMSMRWTFDDIENNHDVYRGKDCVKKFCESLREHTVKIINLKRRK